MQISNNGELSEHVGVKIYLQETDYFTEFKSTVIGNDSRKSSEVKAAYKPFEPSKTEGNTYIHINVQEMKYIYSMSTNVDVKTYFRNILTCNC